MSASFPQEQNYGAEIVSFPKKDKVKYTKAGVPKRTRCNKLSGKTSLVYPIKDNAKLKEFINYFGRKIASAEDSEQKITAARNYLMIVMGLNTGLRISDIVVLRWDDVFEHDYSFKDGIRKQEKKTKKYKTFFLSDEVKDAIAKYCAVTGVPEPNLSEYIFKTRQSNHMTTENAYLLVKNGAKDVGIKQNVGTHTMRKTFCYWQLMLHKNDAMFLSQLQMLMNHSSAAVTLRYSGIEDSDNQKLYGDIGNFYRTVLDGTFEAHDVELISIRKKELFEIFSDIFDAGFNKKDKYETLGKFVKKYR